MRNRQLPGICKLDLQRGQKNHLYLIEPFVFLGVECVHHTGKCFFLFTGGQNDDNFRCHNRLLKSNEFYTVDQNKSEICTGESSRVKAQAGWETFAKGPLLPDFGVRLKV